MTLDPDDPRLDPDTREILRRRAAFIRKSLLGAGLVVALADCGAQSCLSSTQPANVTDATDASDASGAELQVCLTQDISYPPDATDDTPQICLSPREPDALDSVGDVSDPGPDVCLSDVGSLPDTLDAVDDAPHVCLKIAPDALDDTLEDAPQICLSPPAPDVIDDVPDAPQICLSPPAPDTSEPG